MAHPDWAVKFRRPGTALRRAAPQAKPDAHARAATAQVKAQMK